MADRARVGDTGSEVASERIQMPEPAPSYIRIGQ